MKSDSLADAFSMVWCPWSGSLEEIKRLINDCTDIFVYLVAELFDVKTQKEWETSLRKSSDSPSYANLWTFLEEQMIMQIKRFSSALRRILFELGNRPRRPAAPTLISQEEKSVIAPHLSYLPEGAFIVQARSTSKSEGAQNVNL